MAKLLCIETSGPVCSVALFDSTGVMIGFAEDTRSFQHAAALTVLIEALMKQVNCTNQDLGAVALSAGPGSYTGLRIGTSTAKGLCYVLNIPLIALSSLEILVNGLIQTTTILPEELICPVVDARRMEVFSASYHPDLSCIDEGKPKIIDAHSYAQELNDHIVHFVGSGAKKIHETIKHQHLRYHKVDTLSAKYMGAMAVQKWERKDFADTAYFEPFYLKAFHSTVKKS